jgi:NADH dehydrogenase
MGKRKFKKILIFGGTGFLGKSLIKLLSKMDTEIILFTRKTSSGNSIQEVHSNPNIKVVHWNFTNYKLIEENILNSDCVINLSGILYENKQGDFFRVHSDFPALLGELSTKNKINKLIHVSALGVSELSDSVYSRSKAIGERKLIEKFPKAKILRPSLLFGKGDNFFGQFSQMASLSPFLPLISRTTKFQPVFVDDVAMAIINFLESIKYKQTTFEIGGEFIHSFEELLKILLEIKNIKRILIPLNPQLMMIPAFFLQQLPKPPFTVDQMRLLKKDNILDNNLPGLKELGIKPTEMKKALVKIYREP